MKAISAIASGLLGVALTFGVTAGGPAVTSPALDWTAQRLGSSTSLWMTSYAIGSLPTSRTVCALPTGDKTIIHEGKCSPVEKANGARTFTQSISVTTKVNWTKQ